VANRAKMKKMPESVVQSAIAGRMPICRESGKVGIVTRDASGECGMKKYKSTKYKVQAVSVWVTGGCVDVAGQRVSRLRRWNFGRRLAPSPYGMG